jgi:hypothetical protein
VAGIVHGIGLLDDHAVASWLSGQPVMGPRLVCDESKAAIRAPFRDPTGKAGGRSALVGVAQQRLPVVEEALLESNARSGKAPRRRGGR